MSSERHDDSQTTEEIWEDGYPVEHEPDRSLAAGFPLPAVETQALSGYQRMEGGAWSGAGPAEDYAVAPRVYWTEAQRILVFHAYRAQWAQFLEDNETFEMSWPPTANLWTEGHVVSSEVCSEHRALDCEECFEFDMVDTHISPAEWHWRVKVETYEWNDKSGILQGSSDFHFLTTLMDPRDVDYFV